MQVLRLQPGAGVRLFDGAAPLDWTARVERIGKREVEVAVAGPPIAVDRELARRVTIAVGMPANDRMDSLVEKATELGASAIRPLVAARSVLRLDGARAESRRRHWQAIAEAACEQCGRAIVPEVAMPEPVDGFLKRAMGDDALAVRIILSLARDAPNPQGIASLKTGHLPIGILSGPEGGLTDDEEAAARTAGFEAVSLGPRILRADTAPLALLAWLTVS